MIRSTDGSNYKRFAGTPGDRAPAVGVTRPRAYYTAVGGETSLNLASLSPAISYQPGQGQIDVVSTAGPKVGGVDWFETSATTLGFPAPGLQAGEVLQITQTLMFSGNVVAQTAMSETEFTATAGQTTFTADFSWQYNLNASKRLGGLLCFVNGILQNRGSSYDYTEVNLGTANTNQIVFNSPMVGGENVSMIPLFQALDTTAASTLFNNTRLTAVQAQLTNGFQAWVDQTAQISVPYTTILNRAQIPNLASNVRASLGVDRQAVQYLQLVQNESGPAGQPVWSTPNDAYGLIRFVGSWSTPNDTSGPRAYSNNVNDFVEVTFYGTGLNLLCIYVGTAGDVRVSVDGGSEGSNILASSNAGTLNGRNYCSNQVVPVASGLTLGTHTVKLRVNAAYSINVCGFEFLNVSSTGAISANPGQAWSAGLSINPASAQSILYSAPVTGTKGGRVVVYMSAAGAIGQAFTPAAASPSYTSSASHSSEEMVRQYNFREFGAGRSDDFSSAASLGGYAFTLDDGTTSLAGANVLSSLVSGAQTIQLGSGSTGSLNITFVGTGIDLIRCDGTTVTDTCSYVLDGNVIGTSTTGYSSPTTVPIASGLPYGTHVLQVARTTSSSNSINIVGFKTWQPVTPAIPSGSVQISSYNVMANYVANTTVGHNNIGTGTLRKASAREMTYVGSGWTVGAGADPSSCSGLQCNTGTAGNYVQYTFYGTGFDWRFFVGSGACSYTVSVDGSTNLSSYATSLYASGLTFTASTGAVSGTGTSAYANGLSVSGLALGLHTVKLTYNSGTGLYLDCFDIVTPVHSPKSNVYADAQNTLPVGSCSMSDDRQTTPVKNALPATKAWAQAIGVTSSPTTTSTSFVPMPDMSVAVKTTGGALRVSWVTQFQNSSAGQGVGVIVVVDGQYATQNFNSQNGGTTSQVFQNCGVCTVPVAAGTHKVELYWASTSGTITAYGSARTLLVEEK